MTISANCPRTESAANLLDVLARVGFAEYLRSFDDAEPTLALALAAGERAALGAGLPRDDWPGQLATWLTAWRSVTGPLPFLARQLALSPAELFLFGLAVACERHRSIALALANLQAPAPLSRPSVHIALELCARLFATGPEDALALAGGPLVGAGLLALEGDDALPQRVLAVRLPLWRALDGGTPAWPGARAVTVGNANELPDRPVARIVLALERDEAGGVVLRGPPGSGRAQLAAAIAQGLGRAALEVPVATFRDDAGFATACQAARWFPVVRLAPDMGESLSVARPGASLPFAVLAGTQGAVEGDRLLELCVEPPTPATRTMLWRRALGPESDSLDPATLAVPVLYPAAIGRLGRAVRATAESEGRPVHVADLAAARCSLAPEALRRLAQPVTRRVAADALVTTEALAAELEALIDRCRRRETIWRGLGPSLVASTTRGVRALFAGDSGTGKTMAAAYIATRLGAPLYRCELGAVMNKYIGESEKNIASLLDHAEAADVVLLFDEADALFGRRSDGTETGDRYANMLTNYLLTRIEAHHGIIILTTNGKSRIDPAFWRRLDQVIDFPLPGYVQRLALWRSHLGVRAPADEVIERLAAYCDLAGGSIRNAVLAAAVSAPADGPIAAADIVAALRREYGKLGRALPASLAPAVRAA